MKIVEPAETSIRVRIPASLPADSRSIPIKSPMAKATTSLAIICSKDSMV